VAVRPWHHGPVLNALLAAYRAMGETETADVERMRQLAAAAPDPWSRARLPLHFTASALVVHPASGRVLLRWHARSGRWLGVGGHGDPGERDPLPIALREAREESGLADLVPLAGGALLHAVVCRVSASAGEPEHEHADLRFLLATEDPDGIAPEDERSPLRWATLAAARAEFGAESMAVTLDRAERLLGSR
jgi:8-oxo-dGTP pyrophosphatase MutT (NUDIX family)